MAEQSVVLYKVVTTYQEEDSEFPYTVELFAYDADDFTPAYKIATNSGTTSEIDSFVNEMENAEDPDSWNVVNL